jgi:hypothetical protein
MAFRFRLMSEDGADLGPFATSEPTGRSATGYVARPATRSRSSVWSTPLRVTT